MGDEKHAYDPKESLPIPTYEEATSSRPASSLSHLGPAEVSDDAERQGLLGRSGGGHNTTTSNNSRRRDGYQQPSVESVRDSMDSDITMPEASDQEDEEEGLHREMEQLEVIDGDAEAGASRRQRRLRLGMSFSKRISRLTTTLSSLHLPRMPRVPFRMPSFSVNWWPAIPEHLRPGYSVLFRVFGVLLIASLVYALMVTSVFPTRGVMGSPFNPEWARSFVQSNILPARISDNLRHITSVDHVAGSKGNKYLADWMEHFFVSANMDEVGQQNYKVYLNYPKQDGRRVAIVEPAELAWEAIIEEELVSPDLKSNQQTMVFHGLSRAGNVTGPLVYANYGSKEDFKKLKDDGIDLKGAIVLVRYYGTQTDRGMKVKFAEEAGAAGCLIYSDPKDDGFVRGEVYPEGRWRTKDSVQRGSVALTPWIVGDVLTPGWASVEGADRISTDDNPALVNIPSLPLAWRDAQRLLQVLKGHGEKVPETWVGGVPEIHEWWSGDQKSPIVHLRNEQEEDKMHDIYNVVGVIEGIETKAKKIFVGNHRDSWCFGSADPGSGTAIMLEVITALDLLVQQGWRPLRTIVFASWDAEEYNMIGSTEFVEDHLKDVRENAVAYLNVDVGVVGDKFRATGSPIFEQVLGRVLGRVGDPVRNISLGQIWNSEGGRIEGLGAGSDYVAFSSLAGCSSIDIGFDGPENGFPYHSCYETFDWMANFGDPGFVYHAALAKIWALLILELAQEPIYPLSLQAYGAAVQSYISDLESYAVSKGASASFDIKSLRSAADLMQRNAAEFDQFDDEWWSQFRGRAGYETNTMAMERLSHNARMTNFDTHLLDLPRDPHKDDGKQHGVPGREQYKHIIFGPDAWSGYDEAFFPAVRDAIETGDWDLAQKQVHKAADILKRASEKLLH